MCVGEEESRFQLTAYEVGENLHCGAVWRCVQSSLPCVDTLGDGGATHRAALAMAARDIAP